MELKANAYHDDDGPLIIQCAGQEESHTDNEYAVRKRTRLSSDAGTGEVQHVQNDSDDAYRLWNKPGGYKRVQSRGAWTSDFEISPDAPVKVEAFWPDKCDDDRYHAFIGVVVQTRTISGSRGFEAEVRWEKDQTTTWVPCQHFRLLEKIRSRIRPLDSDQSGSDHEDSGKDRRGVPKRQSKRMRGGARSELHGFSLNPPMPTPTEFTKDFDNPVVPVTSTDFGTHPLDIDEQILPCPFSNVFERQSSRVFPLAYTKVQAHQHRLCKLLKDLETKPKKGMMRTTSLSDEEAEREDENQGHGEDDYPGYLLLVNSETDTVVVTSGNVPKKEWLKILNTEVGCHRAIGEGNKDRKFVIANCAGVKVTGGKMFEVCSDLAQQNGWDGIVVWERYVGGLRCCDMKILSFYS